MRIGTLVLLASFALAGPASGEIYKCQGPDGKTLYTTDPSQCPGSEAHVLKGQVQSVDSSASSPLRRSLPAARGTVDSEATQRAYWQAKKRDAEATLVEGRERLGYLERMVTACNRGAELYIQDEDTGIRRGYKCNDVKAERIEVAGIVQQAEYFLEEGLEDECRRAGCLPGWIR